MNAVVVTGCSTGIGRASAFLLAEHGFRVYAGVRRLRDAPSGERITPVELDITDAGSIAAARELVVSETGVLAGLVNNAGSTVPCPVEHLELSVFRDQLEVNLVGHLAVTQAFLPLLLHGKGRIVNVSSVAGKVGGPLMAPYSAAKHGLEGFSDSLRLELHARGVHVAIIEPGLVSTAMRGKLERDTAAALDALPASGRQRYGRTLTAMAETISREAANGSRPEVVARDVLHALTSRRPKIRYPSGARAGRLLLLRRILPDRTMDRLFLRTLGLTSARPLHRFR